MASPPVKLNKVGHKDSDESDAPSNNLWIGNLSADVTDSDLMGLFAKYGALDSVTSYSARSYAFVYFKRVEDAAAAKNTLQGSTLRGNSLRIEFARPAKPCKHLWVGGISPAVSKEQLKEEFLKFGKIEDFKFNRERNAAFIEFVTLEDAFEAMRNMNGMRIGGDQIRVDFLRSLNLRRDPIADFRDLKDGQFSAVHSGVRRVQPSGGRKEGPPSKVLWVGYPPSLQIDEQMIHNAMILFGEIERIKSFPSRNYSFVEFRSVDEARRAKEGLQGRLFNDSRISIMYSSSELAPGKEFSSFHGGIRGPRPEMLNEHLFASGQLEMLDNHRPMGLNTLSGPIPPGSIHRPNMPVRPFVSQGRFDPVLSGSEFNDLGPMRSLRDGNSNIPMGSNWRRPPSPRTGILPSPASRIKPPVSTGWDGLDPNQYQREPKRSRIDAIDDDSFPTRKIDDRGMSLDKTYRFAPVNDAGILGPFQRKRSLSPVGGGATVGSNNRSGNDYIWRGMIAKGGTPVCHARCVPFDKGIEIELPEVVNCSARTGLDMLAKHYAQAVGFDVVFFLPDSEEDFASYTEFLHYLGSKDRAGVAKFDDGTTLFLVPPSDFLTDVLKVKGPERLYGVVLKLPQQPPSSESVEPQLRQPNHFPQYIDKHPVAPFEADYNQIAQEEQMQMTYNKGFHEEAKPPSKLSYPTMAESNMEQSFHQDYTSNNTAVVSQAGILTPELMATLASFLPGNAQSAALEGGQQIPGSSVVGQHIPVSSIAGQQIPGSSAVRPPFSSFAVDKGTSHRWNQSGNPSHLQYGTQFNSQSHIQSQYQPYQPYPPIPNASNGSENMIPGGTQIQDSSVNIPYHGGMQSRPSARLGMASQGGQVAMTSQSGQVPMTSQGGQVPLTSQGGQISLSPQFSQQGYGGIANGTDNLANLYSPSVSQQPSNPAIFSSQAQGGNHSHTQPGMSSPAEKANWEIPNQLQQFQTGLSGSGQGTSEVEGDKNQRYRSTLEFAANLLLQIQQQQAGNAAAQGSGNQQ